MGAAGLESLIPGEPGRRRTPDGGSRNPDGGAKLSGMHRDASGAAGGLFGNGPLILDGGLSTELEVEGVPLDDPLWTARVLLDRPEAVSRAHLRFLEAGADVVTAGTYQASFEGFAAAGLDDAEAERALRRGVRLAAEARDRFWGNAGAAQHPAGRRRPLAAVSVGPYGAFLADGSEYRGDYAAGDGELARFHRRRLETLADEAGAAGAELLAVETIPSAREAVVLADLLGDLAGRRPDAPRAWMSFSCRDGAHLRDGAPLAATVREVAARAPLAAVGVNCTAPGHIAPLVRTVGTAGTGLPVVVYPNGGGRWDAETKEWGAAPASDLPARAPEWRELGAAGIGGCCQVGAAGIRRIRRALAAAVA